MGCTPSKAIKGQKLPQYINYVQVKDKLFSSPKFIFIKFFYQDLYFVAENIIKITSNFDDLVGSFELAGEAIQQLQLIDDLAEIAQILAILPKMIGPMIEASRDPIFSSLFSAKKFAQKYHDFQDDLFVLFKLLPAIEKAKILEPKTRYRYAIHILNCLTDNLDAIDICDYDKQSLTPFKKLVKIISAVRKVMGLIMKLNKYLNSKVMGVSVLSLLGVGGGGGGGFKKTMVKMAIKGLCLPIKAVMNKIVPDNGKIFKYEFQCSFNKPESGWLKLHYALDKKAKKLDLYNCISQEWAKQHLGQLYSQGKVKQYQRIHMPQVKFEIKQGEENEGGLVGAQEKQDFGEIKKQQPTDEISTGCQNTVPAVIINQDDINEQDREAAVKEVEKSINHIVQEFNEISKSIRDNNFQNVEKDEDELSWDESDPEIDDERNDVIQIPLEKRKTGAGSVLSKSFLLVP